MFLPICYKYLSTSWMHSLQSMTLTTAVVTRDAIHSTFYILKCVFIKFNVCVVWTKIKYCIVCKASFCHIVYTFVVVLTPTSLAHLVSHAFSIEATSHTLRPVQIIFRLPVSPLIITDHAVPISLSKHLFSLCFQYPLHHLPDLSSPYYRHVAPLPSHFLPLAHIKAWDWLISFPSHFALTLTCNSRHTNHVWNCHLPR